MALSTPSALPSLQDLLKRSWELYAHQAFYFLGMSLFLMALVITPLVLFDFLELAVFRAFPGHRNLAAAAASGLGTAVAAVLGSVHFLALMTLATHEEPNLVDAFRGAARRAVPFLWTLFLAAFAAAGGMVFLVLPGLWMALWFSFTPLLFAVDGVSGMDALSGSREIFRGKTWAVAARLCPVLAPAVLMPLLPKVGLFLECLYLPFLAVYLVDLYQAAKATLGERAYVWPRGNKFVWTGWIGTALAGGLLVSLVLARGATRLAPDSVAGTELRRLRARMVGVDSFVSARLSRESRLAFDEAGAVVVAPLAWVESVLVGEIPLIAGLRRSASPKAAGKKEDEKHRTAKAPPPPKVDFNASRDPLVRLLGDPDRLVRKEALDSIAEKKGKSYLPYVKALLDDPSSEVRRAARRAMDRL